MYDAGYVLICLKVTVRWAQNDAPVVVLFRVLNWIDVKLSSKVAALPLEVRITCSSLFKDFSRPQKLVNVYSKFSYFIILEDGKCFLSPVLKAFLVPRILLSDIWIAESFLWDSGMTLVWFRK